MIKRPLNGTLCRAHNRERGRSAPDPTYSAPQRGQRTGSAGRTEPQ
jgi:hypothetical protein